MTDFQVSCDAHNPVTTPASLERVWCDAVTEGKNPVYQRKARHAPEVAA